MEKALLNYLLILVAIGATVLLIALIAFCVGWIWTDVIKPIKENIHRKEELYWKERYKESEKELKRSNEAIHKLGLSLHDIECIIPESIVRMTREDQPDMDSDEGLIKFRVDLAKFWEGNHANNN